MEFYTRKEAAEYFRVHPRTVERWLKNGSLKGHKIGNGKTALWRISKEGVSNFLKNHSGLNKNGL